MAATLGAAAIGRAWRAMIGASIALLVLEILGDQNRLQPWAYQYAMIGLALVVFPEAQALRLARLYAIALYLHSGLSKLDASFVAEMGPRFLAAGLSPLGLAPGDWPVAGRSAAVLAMPAVEVAIGAGLALARTRRVALVGAVGLHATLLLILGPWNLGQSPGVLAWNAAMIVEDLLLFGPGPRPAESGGWRSRLGPLARLAALSWFVFPLGERFGLADSWPSHALYASHCERTEVFLHETDLDRFPEAVRRRLSQAEDGPWRRLDLTGWSLDLRGTPLYPQARVGIGVAEWLADRPGRPSPVRAVRWGRANPWDARRDRSECLGLQAIRRQADRSGINAHPSSSARP
jgi:hypothetical protein